MLKRTGSQEMPWGSGLANWSKQVQSSPAEQKTSLESTGGHAGNQQQRWRGQPSLAEEGPREAIRSQTLPSCGPFPHKLVVMDGYSPSRVDFLTNLFGGQHEVFDN